MSLPMHDDSWLRTELSGLLAEEPPMAAASVADDVRRGQSHLRSVRRRRTAAIAVAAVLVAVAIPVGLLARPTSDAGVGPSSGGDAPHVPGVSQQWLERISPALGAQVGWVVDWPDSTVYGDVASGLQLDLTIVPGTQVQSDPLSFAVPSPPYPERASLRIWFAPTGTAPGAALAECPAERCPRDLPDRKFPTYLDRSATASDGTPLAAGTLVLDRTYDSGRFVELVSVPAEVMSASPSDQRSASVLSYGLAAAFLDAVGAPEAAPLPSGTLSPSQNQPAFVDAAQWSGAIAALLPGASTPLADPVVVGNRAARAFRLVRDGVGTSVTVMVEAPTRGLAGDPPPASTDPCGAVDGCTMRKAWTPTTIHGVAAMVAIIDQTGGNDLVGHTGYNGPSVVRLTYVQRGSTLLIVYAGSLDVDSAGNPVSSSEPGLSTEELVAFATQLPLPREFSAAAMAPWRVSGSSSAAASAGSG
jgi:hypothetical protein